jgi:hypothetical protein
MTDIAATAEALIDGAATSAKALCAASRRARCTKQRLLAPDIVGRGDCAKMRDYSAMREP